MSILRDIQTALLSENPDLGTILLRLRLLASRLGSEPLEEWVKHEAEGYPREAEVPSYRIVGVSYHGTFSGPFGSGIRNAPIPPYIVEKYCGDRWTKYRMRESIANVQRMSEGEESIGINGADLIILLQGKVYDGYACNAVAGEISLFAVREIVQAVRARILELTIEIEKRLPEAVQVTLQSPIERSPEDAATVTKIVNNTIFGNVTHVNASGHSSVSLAIEGDIQSVKAELVKAGVPEAAANQLTEIIASEAPASATKPLGKRASDWIRKNAPKAAGGAWQVGATVLKEVAKEAALRYYGLK